jgi:hypothetical protein
MRHTTIALVLVRAATCVVALALPSTALATPDFPAAVVRDLALPGITIDAPQGCTLCHTTDSGGTSLDAFGHLLQQNGLQPYDEPSLAQALDRVGQEDPQLVDDIRAGVDPSADATSTGNVHTPEYGCAIGRGEQPAPSGAAAMVAVVVVVAAGRFVRRSTSRRHPHPPRPARA